MQSAAANELEKIGDLLASHDEFRSPTEKAKLPRYAVIMALYPLGYVAFNRLRKRPGKTLPERPAPYDLLVFGVATHSLSRIITRERVTQPLRAAVTYKEPVGDAEKEKPRGDGTRQVLGELLTCPFCTGTWVAAGFAYSCVLMPRHARFVASIFVIDAVSDLLHCTFKQLQA